jgi:hypothetical protein
MPTIGEQIIKRLGAEVSAAAISDDEEIRREATQLPRRLAIDALAVQSAGTIQQSLGLFLFVYDRVVGDLTGDGWRPLPDTGLARSRINAPFESLLSFTNADLKRLINQAGSVDRGTDAATVDITALQSAEFAVTQLRVAHRYMLEMLRRAVQLCDRTTVRQALAMWKMPDVSRTRNFLQELLEEPHSAGPNGGMEQTEILTHQEQLGRSLDMASDDLDAMILRLLVNALQVERMASTKGLPVDAGRPETPADGNHEGVNRLTTSDPDPAVTAILERLPTGQLWHVLETALETSLGDWRWGTLYDEQILPVGVVRSGAVDVTSPILEAFVLSAIVHPELIAGSGPSQQTALGSTQDLSRTVDRVLAAQRVWLERYGISPEAALQRGTELKEQLVAVARTARREQAERIRSSPILPATADELRAAARAVFHATDITSRLLSWAGNLPFTTAPGETSGLMAFSLTVPRANFISEEIIDIPGHAKILGTQLAQRLTQQLLGIASRNAECRTISRADIALQVRAAITELNAPAPRKQVTPAITRVVVVIPVDPWDLKNDMNVVCTEADSWLHEDQQRKRAQLIEELGLGDDLSWQLVGNIDGVPVLKTHTQVKHIVVMDLARFAKLHHAVGDKEAPEEPKLELIEPGQANAAPGSPASATSKNAAPSEVMSSEQPQPGMPSVKWRLSLSAEFLVSDATAARVFIWEE